MVLSGKAAGRKSSGEPGEAEYGPPKVAAPVENNCTMAASCPHNRLPFVEVGLTFGLACVLIDLRHLLRVETWNMCHVSGIETGHTTMFLFILDCSSRTRGRGTRNKPRRSLIPRYGQISRLHKSDTRRAKWGRLITGNGAGASLGPRRRQNGMVPF